ncbi:MAG: hypothetical protein AUJ75_04245 [Candidatus Omnitrophica bacterium CG1_02_49_10]|nr:MAG: hypothetical protein AUJ75_04245 [Candidatus Omnitrophica bacterium CG1_02_49_10]
MRFSVILSLVVLMWGLTGCAAQRNSLQESQNQQLQMQVRALEQGLRIKDDEIQDLKDDVERLKSAKAYSEKRPAYNEPLNVTPKPTNKKVQSALKNAGFYNGPVDGVIGKKTKASIRDFQAANGLKADGVMGKKTWTKLAKYVE